jgi:hypothetical protein
MLSLHFVFCFSISRRTHQQEFPTHTFELTMDRLFSPCARYRDFFESRGGFVIAERLRRHPELLQELNLDVSTEELLSAEREFTYADLYAMLGNQKMVLWLTPHTAVVRSNVMDIHTYFNRLSFMVDGQHISAVARSSEALSEIVDVVLRLLAVSVVHSLLIERLSPPGINAPTLAYLIEQCQSLETLTLKNLVMDEDHVRGSICACYVTAEKCEHVIKGQERQHAISCDLGGPAS